MGLADILWKAGVACYGTPVTTAGRVHRESTKNVYSLLSKIRLTSYVGLNAGIVYNSDPTSRISNYFTLMTSILTLFALFFIFRHYSLFFQNHKNNVINSL